jgi:hypothetical protein
MPKQIALPRNRIWRYAALGIIGAATSAGRDGRSGGAAIGGSNMADETPVSSTHRGGDQLGVGGGEVALIRATGALRAIGHLRLNRVHGCQF